MNKISGFLIVLAVVLFGSCSEYQRLLKSTDYELKYTKSKEYYNKGEYEKSLTLLNELKRIYMATDKSEHINYYLANCYYGLRDYEIAAFHYENFWETYPYSNYAEEALFKNAFCYYRESPNPRLDQENTTKAITELQHFIDAYPNSNKVDECNKLIDELRDKLVYKSYLSAKLYYDLGEADMRFYESAVIALNNALDEYPDTSFKERIVLLLLKSQYFIAKNSVMKKQKERYVDASKTCNDYIKEFPDSKNIKEVQRIFNKIEKNL